MKTYPAPWRGTLILACRKCQKKLKHNASLQPLAKLKKTIKRHNKTHPGSEIHLVNVPCMDLCPKDGVTVCKPSQDSDHLSILRSEIDIAQLAGGIRRPKK